MGKKEVLAALLGHKKIALLKTIFNSKEELCLKEIAQHSAVSLASTFRLLQEFVSLGLIERKVWKNNKTYLNQNNEQTAFLRELLAEKVDGIKSFLEASADISGIREILLHGEKSKNKANLLLIGENIDQNKVDQVVSAINSQGFELSYVPLTKQQYEQMAKMGLYDREKKVLRTV